MSLPGSFFAQVTGVFLSDDHLGNFVSAVICTPLCLSQAQAIVLCFPFNADPLDIAL